MKSAQEGGDSARISRRRGYYVPENGLLAQNC
jgi:hypothetical protein